MQSIKQAYRHLRKLRKRVGRTPRDYGLLDKYEHQDALFRRLALRHLTKVCVPGVNHPTECLSRRVLPCVTRYYSSGVR